MKREIVLDTETTGLDPLGGDRLVEIGCLELVNHIPTGRTYHQYINPERDMPDEAYRVHGLSNEFLRDKPRFHEVSGAFAEFIEDSTLVIHNAPFDMGFLNVEMGRVGRPQLSNEVIDTVMLARKVHPGARVSLDALCKHYGIDNSRRALHGALLDSEILAEVYLELIGGRQVALSLVAEFIERAADITTEIRRALPRPVALPPRLTEAERAAHTAFIGTLGADALWSLYQD